MARLPSWSPAVQAVLSGKTKGTFTEAPARHHIWSTSGQRNAWGGNESVFAISRTTATFPEGSGAWHTGPETARWVVLEASINPSSVIFREPDRMCLQGLWLAGSPCWVTNFVSAPGWAPVFGGLCFPTCRVMGNEPQLGKEPDFLWWEGEGVQKSGVELSWGRAGLGETPADGLKRRAGAVGAAGMGQ